jgi:hypothetical protein
MPLETARRYAFRYGWILANAPRASGVYALFRGEEFYSVDEADSIYLALMNQWDRKNDAINVEIPTSFAFEMCAPERRNARLAQLLFKCRPTYTAH